MAVKYVPTDKKRPTDRQIPGLEPSVRFFLSMCGAYETPAFFGFFKEASEVVREYHDTISSPGLMVEDNNRRALQMETFGVIQ